MFLLQAPPSSNQVPHLGSDQAKSIAEWHFEALPTGFMQDSLGPRGEALLQRLHGTDLHQVHNN
jgi:hypothetical protein